MRACLMAISSFLQQVGGFRLLTMLKASYALSGLSDIMWSSIELDCKAQVNLSWYVTQFDPSRDNLGSLSLRSLCNMV